MNDWTRPVYGRATRALEASRVRFRIGTERGPMPLASRRIFTDTREPDRRRGGSCSVAMHRTVRNTVRRTMTDLTVGTRDKTHANRTETGRRGGPVGHVAYDPARHRTVADLLGSADRRMD
ncbi:MULTISPECIES: hypothetical protein [unclassified Burkholderia]|uniref:hypothetical protein n=1 Tax=unclassified Burkholderia TaxID=2613784 RepID=UPI000F5AF0CC|nr:MULTISPECIES: hypothetical protein [unclassified Burkholderia]